MLKWANIPLLWIEYLKGYNWRASKAEILQASPRSTVVLVGTILFKVTYTLSYNQYFNHLTSDKLWRMDSNPWTLGFTYTAGSCFPIPHTYMSVEDRCGLPLTCACLLIYHINHQFIQLGRVSGILEKDERIMSLQK